MRARRVPLMVKIMATVGLALAFLLAVGVLSINKLSSVNALGGSMYQDRVVPLNDLGRMRATLGDIDSQVLRSIADPAGHDDYAAQVQRDVATIDATVKRYAATKLVAAETTGLARFRDDWRAYQAIVERILAQTGRGDVAAARRTYFAQAAAGYAGTDQALGELVEVNDAVAKDANDEIASTYASSRTLTIVAVLAAIAIALAVSVLLARSIVRNVGAVLQAARGIAEGDVEQDVRVTSRDEVGDMARAFADMVAYLKGMAAVAHRIAAGDLTVQVQPKSERDALGSAFHRMVASLRDTLERVSATAGTVSASSQQVAATSQEAGKAVGEIATAVADVAAGAERQVRMVERTRESAEETDRAAREARRVADDGARAAGEATHAMTAVRDASGEVTEAIRSLAVKSQEISGIVATITGIAEQTNLLALNAAIEAARAGEQGRGFAVVAEEVRKLAEESQQAAGTIGHLIGDIQAETDKTVQVVEDGARRSEEGSAVVEQARAAFAQISEAVVDVGNRIGEIATSTAEVAAVAEQSSASTEQVSASTEQTSASTQEIAASAQELAASAQELERLVGRFQLTA